MKIHFDKSRARNVRGKIPVPLTNRRAYWAAIGLASLACGGSVLAQTTNAPVTAPLAGATTPPVSAVTESGGSTNVTKLENVTVVGKLDQGRSQIMPDLGATAFTISKDQIAAELQGGNVPFNQVILRAPGVAQDSAVNGDLHVRGEHANLQYRINDVLLPEGITGFGLELDPRFVDSVQLITGALPAQYGFRTAGVVDIQTKSGAFDQGGDVSMYGGSYDTLRPSFEYGGAEGKVDYFVSGSYEHNGIGIENPVGTANPIHDDTDQYKMFTYLSYLIDDTSRVSLMGSVSYSEFQVPNTGGLPVGSAPGGDAWTANPDSGLPGFFDSTGLDERQNEQNYYAALTYQKSVGDLNLQASVLGRESSVHFMPDPVGDLYFNGVASDVKRTLYSGGGQIDASYNLGDHHTLRGGLIFEDESVSAKANTTYYDLDPLGNPTGLPLSAMDDNELHGIFAGLYLQDEWKIFSPLTLNYGVRMDWFHSSFDAENQLSPRANLVYKPVDAMTLHAGYSRYFTPPPVENVPAGNVHQFDGTSNEATFGPNAPDSGVKAERANYFDAGISQKIAPGLQVGVDGYYKRARNQLDDGLFGQTLILSAFNYAKGEIYGVEGTASYAVGGFNTYANVAWSMARGEDWNSSQFLFSPNDLTYVQNHYIFLDHDQRVTGSFGASYTFKESIGDTIADVDALYGSGLRQDGGTEPNDPAAAIPNGASVPSYYSINCGVEQDFKVGTKQHLKARLDIVNVTDNVYVLRSGTGVGVNAAQYGERRGIFGSLSYAF